MRGSCDIFELFELHILETSDKAHRELTELTELSAEQLISPHLPHEELGKYPK